MVWPFTCRYMLLWFPGGMAKAVGQAWAQGAEKGACGTSTSSATNRMGTIQDSLRASLLPQREHKPYGHPDSSDSSDSLSKHRLFRIFTSPSFKPCTLYWLTNIRLTTSVPDRTNVDKSCTDESCMNMYEQNQDVHILSPWPKHPQQCTIAPSNKYAANIMC